jgi:hypothetical protein
MRLFGVVDLGEVFAAVLALHAPGEDGQEEGCVEENGEDVESGGEYVVVGGVGDGLAGESRR